MDEWLIDSTKIQYHPERVAQWLEADTWEKAKHVYPIYFEVTTSAACSHRCTFCSTDAIGYPAILIDEAIISARLREAKHLGVKSVMFAGTGEPLLHKKISVITRNAHLAGLDIAFTTNGVLLDKLEPVNHCTWIKVSLNAGTKETYAQVHRTKPGDWDKVWAGIRGAVARKGKCTIGVQCVVLPENVYEMRHLAQECIDAGVDYLVLKPYSQATFMESHQYEGTKYDQWAGYLEGVKEFDTDKFKVIYRAESMEEENKGKHAFQRCNATPFMWVYSMANGDVFTCSAHLLDSRFNIGNLKHQSFQEIWEGDARRRNWEMMREFDIRQCRLNCRMGKANRYLEGFSKQKHISFI